MVIHSGRPDARASRDARDDLVLRPHRDAALGARAEMKSSLKSGRPLRPDVLNHVPSIPQISHPSPQVANHGNRLRRTRKAIGSFRFAHPSPLHPKSMSCGRIASDRSEGCFFKLPSVSREAGFRVIRGKYPQRILLLMCKCVSVQTVNVQWRVPVHFMAPIEQSEQLVLRSFSEGGSNNRTIRTIEQSEQSNNPNPVGTVPTRIQLRIRSRFLRP